MSSVDLELAAIRLSDAGLSPSTLQHIARDPYLAQRIAQLAKEHISNATGNLRNAYSTDTSPIVFNGNSHPWEEVMKWRIKDITELTVNCRSMLTMQGITRLRMLLSLSMAQLSELYSIGPKSITNITAVLRSMGLSVLHRTPTEGVAIRIGARPNDWVHVVSKELLLECDIRDLTPPEGWRVQSYLLRPPISKMKDLMNTNSSHWDAALKAHILAYNRDYGEANGFIEPSAPDTLTWLSKLQESLL